MEIAFSVTGSSVHTPLPYFAWSKVCVSVPSRAALTGPRWISNGMVPPRFQSGRYYPLEYGGGRRPVPCGHGADRDIRDGLCYPTGTVPRPYQEGRTGYHYRRTGYYEMR